jgi:hypothetical protein
MSVYSAHLFHRSIPNLHQNCTPGEEKEGNLCVQIITPQI